MNRLNLAPWDILRAPAALSIRLTIGPDMLPATTPVPVGNFSHRPWHGDHFRFTLEILTPGVTWRAGAEFSGGLLEEVAAYKPILGNAIAVTADSQAPIASGFAASAPELHLRDPFDGPPQATGQQIRTFAILYDFLNDAQGANALNWWYPHGYAGELLTMQVPASVLNGYDGPTYVLPESLVVVGGDVLLESKWDAASTRYTLEVKTPGPQGPLVGGTESRYFDAIELDGEPVVGPGLRTQEMWHDEAASVGPLSLNATSLWEDFFWAFAAAPANTADREAWAYLYRGPIPDETLVQSGSVTNSVPGNSSPIGAGVDQPYFWPVSDHIGAVDADQRSGDPIPEDIIWSNIAFPASGLIGAGMTFDDFLGAYGIGGGVAGQRLATWNAHTAIIDGVGYQGIDSGHIYSNFRVWHSAGAWPGRAPKPHQGNIVEDVDVPHGYRVFIDWTDSGTNPIDRWEVRFLLAVDTATGLPFPPFDTLSFPTTFAVYKRNP